MQGDFDQQDNTRFYDIEFLKALSDPKSNDSQKMESFKAALNDSDLAVSEWMSTSDNQTWLTQHYAGGEQYLNEEIAYLKQEYEIQGEQVTVAKLVNANTTFAVGRDSNTIGLGIKLSGMKISNSDLLSLMKTAFKGLTRATAAKHIAKQICKAHQVEDDLDTMDTMGMMVSSVNKSLSQLLTMTSETSEYKERLEADIISNVQELYYSSLCKLNIEPYLTEPTCSQYPKIKAAIIKGLSVNPPIKPINPLTGQPLKSKDIPRIKSKIMELKKKIEDKKKHNRGSMDVFEMNNAEILEQLNECKNALYFRSAHDSFTKSMDVMFGAMFNPEVRSFLYNDAKKLADSEVQNARPPGEAALKTKEGPTEGSEKEAVVVVPENKHDSLDEESLLDQLIMRPLEKDAECSKPYRSDDENSSGRSSEVSDDKLFENSSGRSSEDSVGRFSEDIDDKQYFEREALDERPSFLEKEFGNMNNDDNKNDPENS